MSLKYPSSDSELVTIVRDETSYEDTDDELPQSQLDTVIEQSKARLQLETGVSDGAWYSDNGIGFALAGYTKMRSKAAVENIGLSNYSLGAEDVGFHHASPEDSMQLQMWAEEVRIGLDASTLDESGNLQPKDSGGYIGDTYYRTERHTDY